MKKAFIKLVISLVAILTMIMTINIVIDPYFHYHKPLSFLNYPIEYQRYQNNGILRNFEYDAIITGTSMTENFKASLLNELFGVNSVKVSSSGANFKEINDELVLALKYNPNIKMVVRGLDFGMLVSDKDATSYEEDWYPDYLYDDNLINDVEYLLNKSTICSTVSVFAYTFLGYNTTTFDEYSNWMKDSKFGKENIGYSKQETTNSIKEYTINEYEKKREIYIKMQLRSQ